MSSSHDHIHLYECIREARVLRAELNSIANAQRGIMLSRSGLADLCCAALLCIGAAFGVCWILS